MKSLLEEAQLQLLYWASLRGTAHTWFSSALESGSSGGGGGGGTAAPESFSIYVTAAQSIPTNTGYDFFLSLGHRSLHYSESRVFLQYSN